MGVLGMLRCAVAQRRLLARVVVAFVRNERHSPVALVMALGLASALLCVLLLEPGDAWLRHVAVAFLPCLILAALLRQLIHGLLLVPTLAIALCLAAWTALFGLASGYEKLVVEQKLGTRGHLHVRKYGLDFEEYPALVKGLGRRADLRCVLPAIQGSGVLRALSSDEQRNAAQGVRPQRALVDDFREGRLVHIEGWPSPAPDCSHAFTQLLKSTGADSWDRLLQAANPGQPPTIVLARGLAARLDVRVGDMVELVVERDPVFAQRGVSAGQKGSPVAREYERLRHASFRVSGLVHTGDPELDLRLVIAPISAAQGLIFGRPRVSQLRLFLRDQDDAVDTAVEIEGRLNRGHPQPLYRAHAHAQIESLQAGLRRFRFVISLAAGSCMAVCTFAALAGLIALLRRRTKSLRSLAMIGAPPQFDAVVGQGMTLAMFGVGLLGATSLSLFFAWYLGAHPIRIPVPGEVDDLVYELGISVRWLDITVPALVTYLLLASATALLPNVDPRRASKS